eukprot:SAG11_NODE_19369_length_468_cov_0.712737_1_plen_66_part_00
MCILSAATDREDECGLEDSDDEAIAVALGRVSHTAPTATVRITTDLDRAATDASFGIDDFTLVAQ